MGEGSCRTALLWERGPVGLLCCERRVMWVCFVVERGHVGLLCCGKGSCRTALLWRGVM